MKSRIENGVWLISDSGIYEPAPIRRRSWRPYAFLICAVLAIVTGALFAFNN